MSAYFGTMERLLGIEHELMSSAFGVPGAIDDSEYLDDGESPATLAFIDAVVSHQAGEELVARCTLDIDRFPCLRDHTLGRDVSLADPDLPAFPVVPFTMLAEMMAQAATVLLPDGVLIEMRDVRVNRWVAVDGAAITLEMRAQRREGEDVSVQIVQVDSGSPAPVAEGLMRFGPTYPAPPPANPLSLDGAVAYKWEPAQLYQEAMFHGPRFRGVAIVDAVSSGGAVATLDVLDRSTLMAPWTASGLVTDFVLLDQPGQVVGFWGSQYLPERFLVLPFHMASLQLFGPLLEPGTRMLCVAQIQLIGDDRVRAALDVLRADGTLYARFTGWEDRRFDLPAHTLRLLLRPDAVMLSEAFTLPAALQGEGVTARRVRTDMFPAGWLTAHGGLWRRVLAANVLSRAERDAWLAMRVPEARAVEWLLGRIAAKDAVRDYLQQTAGLQVRPADIELLPDAHGRPVVHGAWIDLAGSAPLVSISHVDGVAVAVAGESLRRAGLGVDLERFGRLQPATARIAFTDRELQLLDDLGAAEEEAWSLRMWCAKEACAKALGQGLVAGLHAFAVHRLDRDRGEVAIRFAADHHQPADLLAVTAQDGEWIIATCVTGESVRT
jgi:phosphopantetheinyl transferase